MYRYGRKRNAVFNNPINRGLWHATENDATYLCGAQVPWFDGTSLTLSFFPAAATLCKRCSSKLAKELTRKD